MIQPNITTLLASNKNYMIIVRGIPGSGKSTLAEGMSDRVYYPSVVLAADMYFHKNAGNYDFDRGQLHYAHGWCLDTTKILLQSGNEVFVTNTFVKFSEMSHYFDYAIEHGFGITLITTNNDFGSVHGVPDDAMDRFRKNFQPHDYIIKLFDEKYHRTDNDLNK